MTRLREGSLFTGTNALGMAAAEVLGTEPAWFADIDPGAAKLLAHHYPHTPNLGDITAVDWTAVEPVDVLTGGFPCQDISNAGKREGITGARSGLWSHYADAIRVLRPRYVLVENVGALVVRGLDRVLADLAALGFDAEWTAVRASDVGAPHARSRVFIAAAHPDRIGPLRGREARRRRTGPANHGLAAADAAGDGRHEGWSEPTRLVGGPDAAERGASPADTDSDGREIVQRLESELGTWNDADGRSPIDWGIYESAVHRWEAILGRPAPAPTVVGTRGGRVLNAALPEFMMGLPDGWITSVPGLTRNQQLKLAGNGVVPQQGVAAFRHLLPLLGLTAPYAA